VQNYYTKLEPTLNKVTNLQRAERVVILYLCVRIRVRGGATRLGTGFVPHPEQNPIPSFQLFCGLPLHPLPLGGNGKDGVGCRGSFPLSLMAAPVQPTKDTL